MTLDWQALADSAKVYPLPPNWKAEILRDGAIAFYHADPHAPIVYATPDVQEKGFLDLQVMPANTPHGEDTRVSVGKVPFVLTGRADEDADRYNQLMRVLLPEIKRAYLLAEV